MRKSLVLIACLTMSAPAAGEGFIDIYSGAGFTEDDHVSGLSDVDFEDSPVAGIRGGGWGDGRATFIGGAIDASVFTPDILLPGSDAEMIVAPISFLLMARIPLLERKAFPQGQLQPYAGVGPSLVVSSIDLGSFEDTQVDAGLDVRAGLNVLFSRHVGFFTEYRFTHVSPRFEDGATLSVDLDTHFVQAGLTFRIAPGR